MAKDFRNVSQLPDDFLDFDYGSESPRMSSDNVEKYGQKEADRLSDLILRAGFSMDSDMMDAKNSVLAAAKNALTESNGGTYPEGITVDADDPKWITYYKDGNELGSRYGRVSVNEEYMDRDCEFDEEYPLIPTKDQYEDLGCAWIENGDPSWEDFERVEKALIANQEQSESDEFTAGIDSISGPENDDNLIR